MNVDPHYFEKPRVSTQEDESKHDRSVWNEPEVLGEVPSDWKDKNWSPKRFTQLLKEIFNAKKYGMDDVNLVSANIHYSELPTLLNNAKNEGLDPSIGMIHLSSYLRNVAKTRQKEPKKYTNLLGEAERHALWREIGETPSQETLRKSKMNASPAVIYGMVLMLTKLCKRVKDIPEAATEAIEVLTQWISEKTLDRWEISLPQCENCSINDVTDFCERIKLGIRRDHLLALVEMVGLGAGFGIAENRTFDVTSVVDEFLKKISPDVIDRLIFTPKADEYEAYPYEQIYLELMGRVSQSRDPIDPPTEELRCNFSDELDDSLRPIQCNFGTQCQWTWSSYLGLGGKKRCGCYKFKKWHECDALKCDHSKCNH